MTFSGGEPLMQTPFLTESLGLLRAEGVHTALDTCGYAPWSHLQEAAQRSSLVLYDLKLMDEVRHKAATGQSNRTILENLKALSGIHIEIWIRVPVIPGINDDNGNMEAAAWFLSSLAGVRKVDLLPYHRIGEPKSAAKMDHVKTGGTLLNMKLSPGLVEGEAGIDNLHSLVRSYFKLDGHHMQFNVVGSAKLREAQAQPEQYRDLIVRAAGYSDYFCDLSPALQEEIIQRTEHAHF